MRRNMGVIECASGNSLWRGYDYYKEKQVKQLKEIGNRIYSATVMGSANNFYSVELNLDHPRKCTCDCPHANGKRIICKHIVATYFTVLPEEADRLYAETIAYQEEEAKHQEQLENKVIEYVNKMKKADLAQTLLELLFNGPEWQYDRFVRDRDLDDWY
ncbi:MAG: SWIM zinc finger family protein [Ruminococcaceae bacterium]|nr:SWIM zinc finger family protein [Oscillospiraceae bacterium]